MPKKRAKKKKTSRKRDSVKKRIKGNLDSGVGGKDIKIGFDYGIRPSIASMFNTDFIDLWRKAQPIAMAYTGFSQIGIRVNVPVAGIVCEKIDHAEKLFSLMKSWMEPPCDESAIDISFVSDEEKKQYSMCMSVNPKALLIRTIGEDSERDFQGIGITGGVRKEFPLSNYFRRFKTIAHNKEALVCPIEAPSGFSSGQDNISVGLELRHDAIKIDSGFYKKDILFDDIDSVKANPSLTGNHFFGDKAKTEDFKALETLSPQEVMLQRRRQLRRFFPVTLARLPFNKIYIKAKEQLLCTYLEWQIEQAVCNLHARAAWPKYGYGKKAEMLEIYKMLRNCAQDVTEMQIVEFQFEVKDLKKQINNDMKYLHSYVCPNSQDNPKQELKSKGYI